MTIIKRFDALSATIVSASTLCGTSLSATNAQGITVSASTLCGTSLSATNVQGPTVKFTTEGGLAILMENRTGAASVKGTLAHPMEGSYTNAFSGTTPDDYDCIGVVYENGVANGSNCFVVVAGVAEVLLQNSTAASAGYWARTSTSAMGRADITNTGPPGVVLTHFAEIGHCVENKSPGTDVLAKVVLHFN